MTVAIALLARAPELGRVKSRLAVDVGQESALLIYRALFRKALENAVVSGLPVTLFLAGAGDDELKTFCRKHAIEITAQPDGTLAERMEHALRSLQRAWPAVLLMGSDCPALDGPALVAAAHALESSQVVIQPAEDGGFVLYGERSDTGLAAPFMAARLGTDQALLDTLSVLRDQRATVTMRHVLWDVDTIDDAHRAARLGLLDQGLG